MTSGFMDVRKAVFPLLWLFAACCSAVAADAQTLGKSTAYYYDRYGAQTASKSVAKPTVFVPFVPGSAKLDRPHIFRSYRSGKLRVDVLYTDPGLEATWVRFQMSHAWNTEQLAAALASYGTGWERVSPENTGELFAGLLGAREVHRSQEGVYAWKSLNVQLLICSPDVIQQYHQYLEEEKRQKAEIPPF